MAVGDLVTKDYMYEFNGLALGSGTRYVVEKVSGLLMPPGVRTNDRERIDAHGSFPGRRLYEPRTIAFDIKIDATSQAQVEADLIALGTAFQISETPLKFVYQRPNGFGKRFCWAFVDDSDIDSDYNVAKSLAGGSVQLVCNDPRVYGLTDIVSQTTLAIAATSGNFTATNLGNFDSFPIIQVTGPCTNPTIQNVNDSGKTIKLITGNVPAGSHFLINLKDRTVLKNNGGGWFDAFDAIANDNDWWRIRPGPNQIVYNRDAGNTGAASTLYLYWNYSWIN